MPYYITYGEFQRHLKMKVNEIAESIGYKSADHFSRVFRSEYKMSPQEYRRIHQSQENLFHPIGDDLHQIDQ